MTFEHWVTKEISIDGVEVLFGAWVGLVSPVKQHHEAAIISDGFGVAFENDYSRIGIDQQQSVAKQLIAEYQAVMRMENFKERGNEENQ